MSFISSNTPPPPPPSLPLPLPLPLPPPPSLSLSLSLSVSSKVVEELIDDLKEILDAPHKRILYRYIRY